MRVHELAKDLGIPAKDLLQKLETLGIPAKSTMSAIDTGTIEIVRHEYRKTEAPHTIDSAASKPAAPETPEISIPNANQQQQSADDKITITAPIPLKQLAQFMGIKPNEIISKLMAKGVFATITQVLEVEEAIKMGREFGRHVTYEEPPKSDKQKKLKKKHESSAPISENEALRPPVVTFMGHVDHGKTSLLDKIRKTRVAMHEHGGITQHIGAYKVRTPGGNITFIDTPGHEAFTAMRARGATITDIVVLVIAADDGIMPQTKEAINHCKAAKVPVIVAINKTDLPAAKPDVVKKQLSDMGIVVEDWGGDTICCAVSALTGEGIDHLLEMILLQAEMLELKAIPDSKAKGVIVEAKLTRERGPVATLIVQDGTLRRGDVIVCGRYWTKIKAIFDHTGAPIQEALPSDPVEIFGFDGVPSAGDTFETVEHERTAKEITLHREQEAKAIGIASSAKGPSVTLENLLSHLQAEKIKELKIILKSDVQGSLEAIEGMLAKINSDKVSLKIMHSGVGEISETDIMLASASKAIIIGFNLKPSAKANDLAKKEGVEIRTYKIIYELSDDIQLAMQGLLDPVRRETVTGKAQVKELFKVSKTGIIAGSIVTSGSISKTNRVRIFRNSVVVHDGTISSLRRFKDEVKEVKNGMECGIKIAGFDDILEADIIEAYSVEKISQSL